MRVARAFSVGLSRLRRKMPLRENGTRSRGPNAVLRIRLFHTIVRTGNSWTAIRLNVRLRDFLALSRPRRVRFPLRKLYSLPKRQTMNVQLDDLPTETSKVIQRIKATLGHVKMLPDVAVRALEIARDPESNVHQFADVIQQDMKLASDVLRMSNSHLYSAQQPVAKLDVAIARIGFRQCKNLIIASSFASVMKQMSVGEESVRDALWKHSMTTGVIATHLNRILGTGFDGEEFTAGLVHDIGRTLIAVAFPEYFSTLNSLDFVESGDVLTRENELLGSNHCEVGAWFASDQELPEALYETIRFHHTPAASKGCAKLVALTATADHMANHYARADDLGQYDPSSNPGPRFLGESGVQDAVNRFSLIAQEVFAKAIDDAADISSG